MVRRELAKQFYRALVAVGSDNGSTVTIDFSRLPQKWVFAIPGTVTLVKEKEPPVINALDLIEATLPGLWGYAENAGLKKEECCLRCGKTFKINHDGQTPL